MIAFGSEIVNKTVTSSNLKTKLDEVVAAIKGKNIKIYIFID